jgi:hypothetical protein
MSLEFRTWDELLRFIKQAFSRCTLTYIYSTIAISNGAGEVKLYNIRRLFFVDS